MTISIELNGTVYQGTLYAESNREREVIKSTSSNAAAAAAAATSVSSVPLNISVDQSAGQSTVSNNKKTDLVY